MDKEIYNRLEKEFIKDRHESLRMETVEFLVQKYHNDMELGRAVRDFVNKKNETKDDFKL